MTQFYNLPESTITQTDQPADTNKSKAELITELQALRQRVVELEKAAVAVNPEQHAIESILVNAPLINELTSEYAYVFQVDEEENVACDWVTEAFAEITGYTLDDLIDHNGWIGLLHPSDASVWQDRRDILLSGMSDVREFKILTKYGRVKWIRDYCFPLKDKQTGRVDRLYGAIHDITEHKQMEAELEQRVAQLLIINDIGNKIAGVLELDRVFNRAARLVQERFDYHHIAVFLVEEDLLQLKAVAGSYEDYFPPGHTQSLKDGIIGWVAAHGEKIVANDILHEPRFISLIAEYSVTKAELCLPIKVADHTVGILDIQSPISNIFGQNDIIALETLTDQIAVAIENARLYEAMRQELLEREQLEQQLQQAQKMEAVGRLAGGVAHDFNNLLTIITGYSEVLLNSDFSDEDPRREDVTQIKEAADRAINLTQQLLAFSRRQPLQPKVLNLTSIIDSVKKMLSRLIGEDIQVITNLSPNLGLIKADSGQLEQILMNLAVNARDAMPLGGDLTIAAQNIDLIDAPYAKMHLNLEPGPYVILTISDTGLGMAPEIQTRIFEPFFTTKDVGKGTGLGLSTAYGAIRQNGGHIMVESQLGEGTKFTIYWPRVDDSSTTTETKPKIKHAQTGTETVLLVEDEDSVRKITSQFLQQQGYTVLEANHAQQALQIFSKQGQRIDLLITDVVMPDISGRELAQRLHQERADLKVLYISGYADDVLSEHGMLETEIMFLEKPYSSQALFTKVRETLETQAPS